MAKYKVNLEPVWNLPICRGVMTDGEGRYCAWGLVLAGILGESFAENFADKPNIEEVKRDMENSGIEFHLALSFDTEITGIKSNKKKEMIKEKYVRLILKKGMETGLFELADCDLQIVKDLNSEVVVNG